MTDAIKNDQDKLRFDLIPPQALEELALVYTIGGKKYGDYNWLKGMDWSRLIAALHRHLNKWQRGEQLDQEDGQHHLASVAWAAFTLYMYEINKLGHDDRPLKDLANKTNDAKHMIITNTERTEKVRKMCLKELQALWDENLCTGTPFSTLVNQQILEAQKILEAQNVED